MVYPRITRDEVLIPSCVPSGTLFVSVIKTHDKKKDGNPPKFVSLEDCARGYWTERNLLAAHAYECDYLVAQVHGEIVGAWRIDRTKGDCGWVDSQATPKKTWPSDRPVAQNRKGCELIADEALLKNLRGKRVHLGRSGNTLRGYFENRKR